MPELRRHPGPCERERVVACLRDVNIARADLRSARHEASRGWNVLVLRADLLAALEGYAVAITQLGVPVPRRLRTEIDVYRRLKNRA